MNSYDELWEEIRKTCRENMTNVAYNMWIEPLKFIKVDADHLTVGAPGFKIDLIMLKYKDLIEESFLKIMGFEARLELIPFESLPKEIASYEDTIKSAEWDLKHQGNIEYSFSNFIVGPSNKFAYTASKRVAENPGSVFNPLFIYGNSGLGKTHLLNAIIEKIKWDNDDPNIVYTTSENFTNELIFSLQTKTTYDFHNKYRTCDILLVDDIQFIANKTQTEEEFFHTFDTLIKAGRQIVLTSDKPPSAIPKIEERLRTRFESGLLCDIQPPDFETRVAIVRNKASYYNFNMPDDVCNFIAENIKSNIRQLNSAVKNIYAYCTFNGNEPTLEIAKEALKDILITNQPVTVVIENIIEKTAFTFGVTPEEMKSKRRDANINEARQAAMYIIRVITAATLETIGKTFDKNHSTVNNSLKNVQTKIEKDPKYKNLINELIKNINE